MTETRTKRSRRKDARPGEIIEAALELFVANGFAATKLSVVAERAGVVKGTLYRYFDTKEDIFRATVRHLVATNLAVVEHVGHVEGEFTALVPRLLLQVAKGVNGSRIPAVVRMVLAESRSFPDLAAIWHDEVVTPMVNGVAAIIAQGQIRGEVRDGDPRLHALSVIGPMVTGILYHEVFGGLCDGWPDLDGLAVQHAETVVRGLAVPA